MNIRTTLALASFIAAQVLAATVAHAQAYCALRDPAPQIFELFPEATGYRSHVSTIDATVRDTVQSAVHFSLHARELGQHTLYSPLKDEQPLGIVHVRSEPSEWGIMEIVWSISNDGAIRDFRFQRCRGTACRSDDIAALRGLVRGKTLESVQALLTPDGSDLVPGLLASTDEATRRLAAAVTRSAAKTLAVTATVWADEPQRASHETADDD